MRFHLIGAFVRNHPFGSEIAYAKGLAAIGHEVTTCDPSTSQELDRDADVVIVFKEAGERLNPQVAALKGPIKVVYQPDDARFSFIEQSLREMSNVCDFAFTFDGDGAETAKRVGFKDAKCLLLTADPDIYKPIWGAKKEHDACFVGHIGQAAHHHSRYQLVKQLASRGRTVAIVNGCYDVGVISQVYASSHVVLNHATDIGQPFGQGWGYQCRHFEAAMVGSYLASNEVLDESKLPSTLSTWKRCGTLDEFDSAIDIAKSRPDEIERVRKLFYEEVIEKHSPIVRAHEITAAVEAFVRKK